MNLDTSEGVLADLLPELPDLDPRHLDELWTVIYTHTFQGRTGEAAKLLDYTNINNSVVLAEQLSLMSELMRKRPVFCPKTSSSSGFENAWAEWRDECESRLRQRAFHGSTELALLAKVSFLSTLRRNYLSLQLLCIYFINLIS